MTASADIQTQTEDNVLSVPLNAVTTRDKNNNSTQKTDDNNNNSNNNNNTTATSDDINEVVFVVQKDGTVKQHIVKTGIQDLNNIQVLSGINAGDDVITGPYDAVSKDLKDGAKVKVVSKDQLVQGSKK